MPIEIRLPQLADNVTTARVGAWLKRPGDRVAEGEPIVEVETDKTNVEIEAPAAGVIEKILVAANSDNVPVRTVLALLATGSEVVQAADRSPSSSSSPRPVVTEPPPVPATRSAGPQPEPANQERASSGDLASHSNGDVNATPVARQIARLAGLDLSTVRPAQGGRVTRLDVERTLGRRLSPASPRRDVIAVPPTSLADPVAAGPASASDPGEYDEQPLTPMRRVTATRLQQAKQTIPHFYLQFECRIDALMDLRAHWNAKHPDARLTVTDFILYATSRALREVPAANAAWTGTAVRVYRNVDLAVAVNTPAGLIAPVLRACQRKPLSVIAREISELAQRARTGTLQPAEYTGATFTVSNLGMFGVTSITPIINPPAACILGVGAIEERPVVADKQIVAGHTMSCTLAADHRAIDGAVGAQFMTALRRRLEDPLSLTLEG